MAEDRAALIAHFRQMRQAMLDAIEGLSDAQMTEPSLDGWSVKDHLAHIAFWDEMRASEVERISAGQDTAWRMTEEQDEALNTLAYDLRAGLSLAQVRWELEASGRAVLDAIAAATDAGLDGSRYGEAGLVSRHEAQHTGWITRWRGERGY
ncbi:MAG: DinB family protein [Dehalococcoidia bacterium]